MLFLGFPCGAVLTQQPMAFVHAYVHLLTFFSHIYLFIYYCSVHDVFEEGVCVHAAEYVRKAEDNFVGLVLCLHVGSRHWT